MDNFTRIDLMKRNLDSVPTSIGDSMNFMQIKYDFVFLSS